VLHTRQQKSWIASLILMLPSATNAAALLYNLEMLIGHTYIHIL
jgi:hypothetical protein